jgi:iron complex transport system substrate-binding protein
MKLNLLKFTVLLFAIFCCWMQNKNEISSNETRTVKNEIHYAKGFEIYSYKGYSIVRVRTLAWSKENFTYILQEKTELFR